MWRLDPQLSACIASGRIILLDETRDRYLAVPAGSSQPVLDWLNAADGSPAPRALWSLLGDKDRKDLSNRDKVPVEPPEPGPVAAAAATPSFKSVVSVASAVASTRLALRTRRLGAILKRRRQARADGPATGIAALRDLSRLFAAARRWCPVAPNCLLDSLALDRWLGSPGDIQLIFGVVGQPFEAHCWVQSAREVLNDSYDRVSRFEAILRI